MHSFEIRTPQSKLEIAARNLLLQNSLRPSGSPPIEAEYPIVLDTSALHHSLCVFDRNQVVAHANFQHRRIQNKTTLTLVGNVASHPAYRNQGLIRSLMDHIAMLAASELSQALILWSDLNTFYQKLGFKEVGKECRFYFSTKEAQNYPSSEGIVREINPKEVYSIELERFLQLRTQNAKLTLDLTPENFARVLRIPDMCIFVLRANSTSHQILNYAIIGKGADMTNVIHDWGGPITGILTIIRHIFEIFRLEEIILLAPSKFQATCIAESTVHPLCLARSLSSESQTLLNDPEFFIWGLDSI